MTDGIRTAMKDMTGAFVSSCPWRAFKHPLVSEVMQSVQWYESGNLDFAIREPSHRLVEGIRVWNQAYNRMYSRQLELDRIALEQERDRDRARGPVIRTRRRR